MANSNWKKGVDKDNYFRNQYGAHLMELMSTTEVTCHVVGTGLLALSIGIFFHISEGIYNFLYNFIWLLLSPILYLPTKIYWTW